MSDGNDELFNFPCDFPIKVMGQSCVEFEQVVVAIARRHAPDLGEGAVRANPSRTGRFTALTITVRAHSREQLDNLYSELTACEHVAMVL